MEFPYDFGDLIPLDISFRERPHPSKEELEAVETLVRRYAFVWGLIDEPKTPELVAPSCKDPATSPCLSFLKSLGIEDGEYFLWHLSCYQQLEMDEKDLSYWENHLILARMDVGTPYCTGFFLDHPMIRDVEGLLADHFAYVDFKRYQERERILQLYRDRIAVKPRRSGLYYDLALMVWYCWWFSQPHPSYVTTYILPGPLDEAIEPLEKAVSLAPRNIRYWGFLGEIYFTLLQIDKAIKALERACELDPENPRWVFFLSEIYMVIGDEASWHRELERAKKIAVEKRSRIDEFNAHEIYWESLDRAVEKLRGKVENIVYPTDQEIAEADRADISVDPENVPEDLRDLIPFVEMWGLGDDVSRLFFVERATNEEVEALKEALSSRVDRIQAWLDSFPDHKLSKEAGYFLFMLEAADEMGL